jgi:hypothetical protein
MSTTPVEPYVHPETGVLITTEQEWRAAFDELEERLKPLYRLRRQLAVEHAVRFEPTLPERRAQSDAQQRVARCPRCGGPLEDAA